MLGEVVADKHVEQIGIAAQVRIGQRDQLPVSGRGGVPGGPGHKVDVPHQERGGHEDRCRGGVSSKLDDLGAGVGVITDQAVK